VFWRIYGVLGLRLEGEHHLLDWMLLALGTAQKSHKSQEWVQEEAAGVGYMSAEEVWVVSSFVEEGEAVIALAEVEEAGESFYSKSRDSQAVQLVWLLVRPHNSCRRQNVRGKQGYALDQSLLDLSGRMERLLLESLVSFVHLNRHCYRRSSGLDEEH